MTIQTYTIELKIDASEEAHEALTEIAKQYARDLLASAMILSGGKQPQIICRTQDSFYTQNEIEVLDPSDNAVSE